MMDLSTFVKKKNRSCKPGNLFPAGIEWMYFPVDTIASNGYILSWTQSVAPRHLIRTPRPGK